MIVRPPGQLQWFMRRLRSDRRSKRYKDATTGDIIASVIVAFVILLILDLIFMLSKLIH